MKFKDIKEHRIEVERISQTLKTLNSTVTLSKTEPSNTLRDGSYKKSTTPLPVSSLNSILEINIEKRFALVEPRVTIKELCKATFKFGFIPKVVPEFASITVGGAIMGAAIESSSHIYGQFNDTCLEYELVLGNGEIITASDQQNSDLFYGLSGSYGSLALLTLAKIELVEASPYVHVIYHRFQKQSDVFSFFQTQPKDTFLDGLLIDSSWSVAMTGNLTSKTKKLPTFKQRHSWDPWFYQHVVDITDKGDYEEYMPTLDYLFRLDRGAFWMGRFLLSFPLMLRLLFRYQLTTIHNQVRLFTNTLTSKTNPSFLFRLFFGNALSSKNLYYFWHLAPSWVCENLFFVQDFYAPASKADSICTSFIEKTEVYPVWLCPVKGTSKPQFLSPHYQGSSFVNIGLYGIPKNPLPVPQLTRDLEQGILDQGGRKMLYSMTYYPKEQFNKIYDEERCQVLRKKYFSEKTFLPLYNKVCNVV